VVQSEEDNENLPLPTSKEQLIVDLKDNIEWNNREAADNIRYGFLGSFTAAALFAMI